MTKLLNRLTFLVHPVYLYNVLYRGVVTQRGLGASHTQLLRNTVHAYLQRLYIVRYCSRPITSNSERLSSTRA